MKSIADICEINPPKKEIAHMDGSTEVSFIPMTSVSEQGQIDLSEVRILDEVRTGFTYFKNGDVLFAKITPCMENGKGALVDELVNGVGFGSTEFHVLRPKQGIDGKWLYYVTKSKVFRNTAEINMTGSAGQKRVPTNFFDKYKVFVPTLKQQRRIAQILDKAQQLIDKRKEQIEACDELIKSQFIEMFGDLVSNSKEWKQEILDKHLEIIGGYAFKSDRFVEKGVPVLKIGNINAGYFKDTNLMYWVEDSQLQRYAVYPGDLVISLTGTVGKDDYGNVCIMGTDFPMYYLNQRNAKLKLGNTLDKYYLTYALKVPGVKRKLTGISRGVRQANISNKDIQNLELPIPPIELQNEFATLVQQVDKLKFEMEQSLVELENNFNALMQRAFKGELF